MKKDLILVIFPYKEGARWYFEDNIKPLMPFLKKKDMFTYESDTYTLKLCSYNDSDNLRGLRPEYVYLYEECSIKVYNNIIVPLVKGDHNRIKVVV